MMSADTLSAAAVQEKLQTRWAGRGGILYAREMPSTNAVLKEAARQGMPHGTVAVCHHQTAGKGRIGRRWETPPGEALTFSLLLRPRLQPEEAQLCTLAAALAMARTIRGLCPGLAPRIKWPNDVVLGQGKCCGILSEMGMGAGGVDYVVTGVGLNVNQTAFPEELANKAVSLLGEMRKEAAGTQPLDRTILLCRFLREMEDIMDAVEAGGFAAIRADYEAASATIGQPVQVIAPAEQYTGVAQGVDATGALLVRRQDGCVETVLCGDVSVRGLMGYV
ncbi:MAG: biotin--[acetyl-CoA-carboxylase] ligase [Clostridiales bacterium]|nr:biotin--[acetyl-CoA-carboxylase] ligase [Clostridiales bacterium]